MTKEEKILKILAAEKIYSSNKLSEDEKVKLIDFLKNHADLYQTVGYFLDETFYHDLDDISKDVIYDRIKSLDEAFKEIALKGLKSVGGLAAGLAGFMVADAVLWRALRTVRATADANLRKCGVYKEGVEHERCIVNVQLKKEMDEFRLINQLPNKCKQKYRESPDKLEQCMDRVKNESMKKQETIRKLKERLSHITLSKFKPEYAQPEGEENA